jgi:pre-rRNA-processing protein TSR3
VEKAVPIHAIWLAQDDAKKNTAVRLSKGNKLQLHKNFRNLPRRGILLDPLCGKVFGPEDHAILSHGLVGLDCSWANIEESVATVNKRTRLVNRMLPLLLAANPVNWGKPSKLCTAEALAATLYLSGRIEQATHLLSQFNWGSRFIELNYEPLEAYRLAKTSAELVQLQFEFFDID